METISHYIAGKYVDGGSDMLDVHRPSTGEVIARVAAAGPSQVDHAVSEAGRAFTEWSATSLANRQTVFFEYRNLLNSRQDDIADLITTQNGKTHADALGEIGRGVEIVEYACGLGELLKGEYSDQVSGGVDVYSMRQPLGVCVGITPFNFPAMVPLWMFPMAIAAGNTFVLKPSERDPSASNLLAELATEAGFPDGVLNVLHGDRHAVAALLEHPTVAAVSFVGSTPVARHVYETSAKGGKRVQALGGAKNHMVVLPDADLESAADAAVSAGFGSAGERCMAISVVVAVGDVADKLVPLISERAARLRVGDGAKSDTDMGPLISAEHRERVAAFIGEGAEAGATVVLDGRDLHMDGNGFFLGPTVLDDVKPDMSVYAHEIFGPVLLVMRVDTPGEALLLINESPYGNGVAVFTGDGGFARSFTREVQCGMVGINIPVPVPIGFHSFGGWKASLFGDHHIYGPEAVRFYTRGKAVTARWPKHGSSAVDLSFAREA